MSVLVFNNAQALHRNSMWRFTLIIAGLCQQTLVIHLFSSPSLISSHTPFLLSFLPLSDPFILYKRRYSKDGTSCLRSAIPPMTKNRLFSLFVTFIFSSFKASLESVRMVRRRRNGKLEEEGNEGMQMVTQRLIERSNSQI